MGLLDGIEKIINEHGSAVILKERIALAEDKYAALGQKLALSESRVVELESEKKALQFEAVNLRQEIQRHQDAAQNKISHSNHLQDVEEKLLQFLCENEDVPTSQIARSLDKHLQLITLHLTNLAKTRFVVASYNAVKETEWAIDHAGRAYLVQHGLLT